MDQIFAALGLLGQDEVSSFVASNAKLRSTLMRLKKKNITKSFLKEYQQQIFSIFHHLFLERIIIKGLFFSLSKRSQPVDTQKGLSCQGCPLASADESLPWRLAWQAHKNLTSTDPFQTVTVHCSKLCHISQCNSCLAISNFQGDFQISIFFCFNEAFICL